MKAVLFLLVLCISISGVFAQNAKQSFAEGQRAFASGNFSKAREKFDEVLAVDPQHKESLRYIGMIAAREKGGDPAAVQQKKLAAIVFPVVNFKEADLPSVLEFLKQEGEKLATNDVKINFVSQVTGGTVGKPVTLSLNNIPFLELLRYIGQIADVSFTVEQFAIVVAPAERTGSSSAADPGE